MHHHPFVRVMLGFLILGFGLITLSRPVHSQTPKVEQTLSMIKPDAVRANHIGAINQRFEDKGLKIIALKMIQLSPEQAGQFYSIHKEKPFYHELKNYMSSGPVVVQVLEGVDAIALNRKIMGNTDPKQAEKGTIRADFAQSISENAVHGSDSAENAKIEIQFFFNQLELHS